MPEIYPKLTRAKLRTSARRTAEGKGRAALPGVQTDASHVQATDKCGHEANRDVNAAANLALYPLVVQSGQWPRVAAKHAETENACGERSTDALPPAVRETPLDEAGTA